MCLANHQKNRDKCPVKHRIQQEKRLDKKCLSHQHHIQDYAPYLSLSMFPTNHQKTGDKYPVKPQSGSQKEPGRLQTQETVTLDSMREKRVDRSL